MSSVLTAAREEIEQESGGRLEYLEALNAELGKAVGCEDCAFLAAALGLGSTRLIDNVRVPPGRSGDGAVNNSE